MSNISGLSINNPMCKTFSMGTIKKK